MEIQPVLNAVADKPLICPACGYHMADIYNCLVAHICDNCESVVIEFDDKTIAVEYENGGGIVYVENY